MYVKYTVTVHYSVRVSMQQVLEPVTCGSQGEQTHNSSDHQNWFYPTVLMWTCPHHELEALKKKTTFQSRSFEFIEPKILKAFQFRVLPRAHLCSDIIPRTYEFQTLKQYRYAISFVSCIPHPQILFLSSFIFHGILLCPNSRPQTELDLEK